MMEKVVNCVISKWVKNGWIKEEEKLVYHVGLDVIISTIVQTAVIWSVGRVVFHDYYLSLIFLICFATVREHSGGYHAATRIRCMLTMLACYLFVMILIKCSGNINGSGYLIGLSQIVNIYAFIRFAPAENTAKKTVNAFTKEHKRKAIKWLFFWQLLAVFAGFLNYEICSCILLTLLTVTILILVCQFRKFVSL